MTTRTPGDDWTISSFVDHIGDAAHLTATPAPDKALMRDDAVGEHVDAQTARLQEIADGAWGAGPFTRGAAMRELAARAAATPTPVEEPEKGAVGAWRPIEEVALWDVAVVTNGENVAISQKAEADDGTVYWAIDPEDGLDWEPTHYVPPLDAALAATNAGEANSASSKLVGKIKE